MAGTYRHLPIGVKVRFRTRKKLRLSAAGGRAAVAEHHRRRAVRARLALVAGGTIAVGGLAAGGAALEAGADADAGEAGLADEGVGAVLPVAGGARLLAEGVLG